MGFSVSPSIVVKELDLTATIPALATSIGALAGYFKKGPVEERVLISSEEELVNVFGAPSKDNWEDWFAAKNFLSYSNALECVRVVGAASTNACDVDAAGVLIKNKSDFEVQNTGFIGTGASGALNNFIAKTPGSWGNKLVVQTSDSTAFPAWSFKDLFDIAPGSNEVAIVVYYDGDAVERFIVNDSDTTAKDIFGYSTYVTNVINDKSEYVYVDIDNATFTGALTFTLATGAGTDVAPVQGDVIVGFDKFANAEEVDINLVFMGGATDSAMASAIGKYIVSNIAEVRKDCIAVTSMGFVDVSLNAMATTEVDYRKGKGSFTSNNLNVSSTYGVCVSNYKYQYDKYNDIFGWVNFTGDVAGLMARTDQVAEPWFSPAGFARGQIKNVVKTYYTPTKAERDKLYLAGINPIIAFPGRGTVLYGDKTMVTIASAFDRINVRRLFSVVEKAISTAADSQLFELNDSFSRSLFSNLVEPYLRDVQAKRGIYNFKVIVDESVNTPAVVDANSFKAVILIQPSKSTNFIQLSFVAVQSGISFDELLV